MNFPEAIKSGFSNYFVVSGRTPRSGYWFWVLFCFIGGFVTGFIDGVLFGVTANPDTGIEQVNISLFSGVFTLVTLIPGITIGVRRLHDIDRNGWWLLIGIIPLIGWILLLVWFCSKGTEGTNRFGENPLNYA